MNACNGENPRDGTDHATMDTMTGWDIGFQTDYWHARCVCGYQTFGFTTPDKAITALEKGHLRAQALKATLKVVV
jgi:hypothetical protein